MLSHTVLPAVVVAGVLSVDAIVDIITIVVVVAHDVTAAARGVTIMLVADGGQLSRTPGRPVAPPDAPEVPPTSVTLARVDALFATAAVLQVLRVSSSNRRSSSISRSNAGFVPITATAATAPAATEGQQLEQPS